MEGKQMKAIKIELTRDEHKMITAILMMHHIGMVIPVHKDKRPLLDKIAQDFSLRDMRLMIE